MNILWILTVASIATVYALTLATITVWRGRRRPALPPVPFGDRRGSTAAVFARLVDTYDRPPSQFVQGSAYAYADALSIITGRAHAGILSDAAKAARS